MKVPFTLRRIATRPAQALLLLSADVADLLALCARVGAWPAVHTVAGGFLVRLPRPSNEAYANTIRLRALSSNLFVPCDADLSPALLGDEAAALVHRRGLIFLPSGAVLAFAPDIALQPVDLLAVPRAPRRAWLPLPARPARPDRLHEVVLDVPPADADAAVAAGGGGIGEASPRPGDSGAAATAAGHTLAGIGRGLAWLGSALNLDALTKLGGNMVEQGMQRAPRVSEAVLGKQQAALRELLRQFREGDLDAALRHALPLNAGDAGHPAAHSGDVRLPTNGILYSLAGLLGGGAGASAWATSGDVFDSLAAEYRKAAEAAARKGDHRRAAFIYGKLLGDWRPAAAALERGGLHHDAAIVYLQKLGDVPAAARAYESGGEIDRALEMFVAGNDHAAAGDLLTRAGEPERALEHYRTAAAALANRGDQLAAGELMLRRAQRADLAEVHFRVGWRTRAVGVGSQGCLLHLLDLYCRRSPPTDLLALTDDADDFFARNGTDAQAAAFYNELARRADALAERQAELRDRALSSLAARVRQRAEAGHVVVSVVQGLLTLAGGWEPALIRDAEFALRGDRLRPRRAVSNRTNVHRGQVTAACVARATGDVFVGYADGRVMRHDPVRGGVPVAERLGGRVDALSVDDRATLLVAVYHDDVGHQVVSYRLGDRCETGRIGAEPSGGPTWLSNVHAAEGRYVVGLFDGETFTNFTGQDLMPEQSWPASADLRAAIVLSAGGHQRRRIASLLFDAESWLSLTTTGGLDRGHQPRGGHSLPWALADSPEVCVPPLSWSSVGKELEIAAVTAQGELGWAKLRLFGDGGPAVLNWVCYGGSPYLAAALLPLPTTKVVGVTAEGVTAFAPSSNARFETLLSADLHDAAACFWCAPPREVVVVCKGGDVVRVTT